MLSIGPRTQRAVALLGLVLLLAGTVSVFVRATDSSEAADVGPTPADRAEFDAPATPWRIAAGASAIAPQRNAP